MAKYTSGKKAEAISTIESLKSNLDDTSSHYAAYFVAVILVLENRLEEASELLVNYSSLETISLYIQILLLQNHLDDASRQTEDVRRMAQDDIVFNLFNAWVSLRKGGASLYQEAFYIYEELAIGGTATFKSLLGQTVAQIQLGRLPEAENTLAQALELEPENPDILISEIVFNIISNKPYQEAEEKLKQVAPNHPYVLDIKEKSQLFDEIAAGYSA